MLGGGGGEERREFILRSKQCGKGAGRSVRRWRVILDSWTPAPAHCQDVALVKLQVAF